MKLRRLVGGSGQVKVCPRNGLNLSSEPPRESVLELLKLKGAYRNFGTLSVILFTSKYFTWKFHPRPSFYLHPNIPDRFVEAEMNIFWFSFSISLQNIRKKGTSWILSNISPKKRVHRYLQNTIFNFKLKFHLEDGLVQQRYFEFFSWPGLYFHPAKDRCSTRPYLPFFTFVVILVQFSAPKSSNFFLWVYGTWWRAANIN